MSPLPHIDLAQLDIRKLRDYCLDDSHLIGRHKARLFRAALNLTRSDAEWLRQQILELVRTADAQEIAKDVFGTRYRADIEIARHGRRAMVRTIWILATDSRSPRFVTCWIV